MDADQLLSHWASVRSGLLETIEKFREDELGFSPFPAGRTVRQIILHIALEERGEFGYGITRELGQFPDDYAEGDFPDRESLRRLLQEVHLPTVIYLEPLTDAELEAEVELPWGARYRLYEMIWHIIEHDIHHRGELSLILGILGREGFDA